MNKNMFKLSGFLMLVLFLNGCVIDRQQEQEHLQSQRPFSVEPVYPSIAVTKQPQVELGQTVPQPPKMRTLNWLASMSLLVAEMLKTDGIALGNVLLVDNVKNNTNGSLQSTQATTVLQNALANNGKFTLVTSQQLAAAKQAFGLSTEDSLMSRSKTIGLAHYVGAQYILYSNAEGNVKSPTLQMWLVLVQTGEIIWSGSGDVQY